MARALALARRGVYSARPNPRVGCVIVRNGAVVGEGWHVRTGGPHAEIVALEDAGERARGADVYVTLEPCAHHGRTPPCAEALVRAEVARVFYACPDPNPSVHGAGARLLADAGIETVAGCLGVAAAAENAGFFRRMRSGMPRVISKIAASLDGRTALANGTSQWITGPAARTDVQRLRASCGAILTGIDTVLADDPAMNVRDESLGELVQPLRAVLDSNLRMPTDARMFNEGGAIHIFATRAESRKASALESAGAIVHELKGAGRPDPTYVLAELAALEVNDVLVEAGPVLNGSLLSEGLIEEMTVYLAPHVLGDRGRGMFALGEITSMADRPSFRLAQQRVVGDDLRLVYKIAGS
jgi:diaminohydroxyphosphoribosylaminopyrimidine deaminase/5-amino-6-(5-phosphoribosylamino)uracil reductase